MDNNIIDVTSCNVLPMPAVLKTANGQEIKYIRRDEVQRIMSVLEGRDRLMVEALWNTGGRISEVLELTSQAVNFDDGTITIRTLKKKKRLPKNGKDIKNEIMGLSLAIKREPGSKIIQKKLKQAEKRLSLIEKEAPLPAAYRTVSIRAELAGSIAAYCMKTGIKKDDRIFPITRIRAYQIISKAAEKTGIEKDRRHPHVFRHGFAVNAVLSGLPPMVLRRWMGHASIDTTLIYTEVLAQDTKEYLNKMKF